MPETSPATGPVDERVALRVAGVNLKVAARRSTGGAEALLLVHGLACAKESFDGIWRRPLAEQLSVIAPDLPGFGASSRPERFSYSMEDQAAVLAALLARFDVGRVHLLAHSMGGAPALLLAEQLGSQVASFVSVEGNLVAADCGMISRRTAKRSFARFCRIGLPVLKTAVRRSDQPAMRAFGRWLEMASPWAFWKSSISLVEWSDSGELLRIFRDLAVPKRYVYGERSGLSTVLDELGEIETVPIAGAGHFVMQDAGDALWSAVERLVLGGSG